MVKKRYGFTVTTCYIGYIIQAIVNNLSPLLFVQFATQFSLSPAKLSLIVFLNFGIQILVDSQSATIALKFGYRKSAIVAHLFSAVGLIFLGTLPFIIHPYAGILISTLFTAIGGGFIEVVLSPLVEALPLSNKSGAMCMLHSFYCWGHILVVLLSTLYFNTIGIAAWRFLPMLLAILPALNAVSFSICPIESLEGDEDPASYRSIFRMKGFFIFLILMTAAGAAEQAIAQWASYFAEIGLSLPNKTVGDIFGTCLFALGMAASRTMYGILGDKIDLKKTIAVFSVFLLAAYLLTSLSPLPRLSLVGIACGGFFVGIMWPGIYSLAGKKFTKGGTKMFGMLALAGDVGCTLGPTLVGLISDDIRIGLGVSAIFPALIFLGILLSSKKAAE